jgi:hypothetical protein
MYADNVNAVYLTTKSQCTNTRLAHIGIVRVMRIPDCPRSIKDADFTAPPTHICGREEYAS